MMLYFIKLKLSNFFYIVFIFYFLEFFALENIWSNLDMVFIFKGVI